jgi:hypothetical protein
MTCNRRASKARVIFFDFVRVIFFDFVRVILGFLG